MKLLMLIQRFCEWLGGIVWAIVRLVLKLIGYALILHLMPLIGLILTIMGEDNGREGEGYADPIGPD